MAISRFLSINNKLRRTETKIFCQTYEMCGAWWKFIYAQVMRVSDAHTRTRDVNIGCQYESDGSYYKLLKHVKYMDDGQ